MAGPLDGVRVVDVTQMISGPVATRILADQGADVVKIEPPGRGDLMRSMGGAARGLAPIFATTNRNKRSLALDLRTPEGRAVVERLVERADVFVQNFRPGVIERMGLGEEALRARRPDLVYVSISGFGERGPYAAKRVYDPLVQALSGLADIQGGSAGRPRMVRLIVPDKVTALTAAQAVTAALFARARGGPGQHVRVAMLDAMIVFLWPEGMARHTFVGLDVGVGRPRETRDLVFETRDGYITVGVNADAEWEALARCLGHPEWLEDPRFRNPASRVKHADARLELTAEALRTRGRDEWLRLLDEAQVPCAPVLTREEVIEHPQVVANELIVQSEHPHAGRMRSPRPAARFDATPAEGRRGAPLLGEQSREILAEIGLDAATIDDLFARGIAGPAPPPVDA